MASNQKATPKRSRPARAETHTTVPVAYMRDLASDGIRHVPASEIPDESAYVIDKAGAQAARDRGYDRNFDRMAGKRLDPSILLNDVWDALQTDYDSYAEGFTRAPKAQLAHHRNAAKGAELRPGFVAFLTRRIEGQDTDDTAGQVVLAILDALYAAGPLEQKWATAVLLRLRWGLTHEQIADDMALDRTTVTRYLQEAAAWIKDYLADQAWIQAYLYNDAAPRYHIDPYLSVAEMLEPLSRAAS